MDSATKRRLFIELAEAEEGATAQDVHAEALRKGTAGAVGTVEAFHNLGRRLERSGRLFANRDGPRTVYFAKLDREGTWIDEDELQTIVDPERPMDSLAVLREASRQLRQVEPAVWREAARVLAGVNAREGAINAITAYADNLVDHLQDLERQIAERSQGNTADERRSRQRCQALIDMLTALCRDGLGLSYSAVHIPITPDVGIDWVSKNGRDLTSKELLRDEISRRVEDVPMLNAFAAPAADERMIVAGVDGSTQGGLLSHEGTAGDPAFGGPPQINLNTAAAVLNREVRNDGTLTRVFLRVPSAPEHIQTSENTYTIMSPMFFSDLSDVEYMHTAWNAMDCIESRVAKKAMHEWRTPRSNVEVQPADVVIRDGTVVPNDRDPSHYANPTTYGDVVRELVGLAWDMARKSQADRQTVAGAVKNSQVRVVGPIINYILAQKAGTPGTNLTSWSLDEMNTVPDQRLLSALLANAERDERTMGAQRHLHATIPRHGAGVLPPLRVATPHKHLRGTSRSASGSPPTLRRRSGPATSMAGPTGGSPIR